MNRRERGTEPVSCRIAGRGVSCTHCQGIWFHPGGAQLNQGLSTLLGLDAFDRTAAVLECVTCGQLLWFAHPLE